jgi:hypothetical protein
MKIFYLLLIFTGSFFQAQNIEDKKDTSETKIKTAFYFISINARMKKVL